MSTDAKPKAGLEHTVATSSATCCPDDDRDVLACCGYDIRDVGIPIDLFTSIFAVSRVSGWRAHALDQCANSRLIPPRAEYIGPEHPQRHTPLEAH